ncbi:hypothetical protein LNA02_16020 [Levilactobacillus namurensis]|nr:hypothetical protein LNA02_16020 [Levilactobacillus namurensis]
MVNSFERSSFLTESGRCRGKRQGQGGPDSDNGKYDNQEFLKHHVTFLEKLDDLKEKLLNDWNGSNNI